MSKETSFALERRKALFPLIQVGDGLVGMCISQGSQEKQSH